MKETYIIVPFGDGWYPDRNAIIGTNCGDALLAFNHERAVEAAQRLQRQYPNARIAIAKFTEQLVYDDRPTKVVAYPAD